MSRRQRSKSLSTSQTFKSPKEISEALNSSRYQFVSFLTALFIVAAPSSAFEPGTTVLAIAGLGLSLFKHKWFWPAMFALALVRFVFSSMYSYDNHEWLLLYWLLALAIYSFGKNSERQFQITSRLLIGLTFLFATAWKILSPEFRSGAFFEFAGATEPRFTDAFTMMGNISAADVSSNLQAIAALKSAGGVVPFSLIEVSGYESFWMFLTIATIVVEGALAVTFLAPLPRTKLWIRDVLLGGFTVGTYLVMPVLGFGQLLCVLGYGASDLQEKKRKYVYVGLLVFVQVAGLRDTVLSWLT